MQTSYGDWLGERRGQVCVSNLQKNGFDAHWVADLDAARSLVLSMTAPYKSFGFGGSDTVRKLNIIDTLTTEGKTVYDHWRTDLSTQAIMETRKAQLTCDCFFCSANAISMTGEIVNVDGAGNRTSAMGFGPARVIIVAGINKLANDLQGALQRIRDVAAPMRAKSLNMKTPCAETGLCSDCHSPQRICRITTILHRQPMLTQISVVLVNQAMGY